MNIGSERCADQAAAAWGRWDLPFDYLVDASQRGILYWDVMRQRGNQYREHLAETAPHVLNFETEARR